MRAVKLKFILLLVPVLLFLIKSIVIYIPLVWMIVTFILRSLGFNVDSWWLVENILHIMFEEFFEIVAVIAGIIAVLAGLVFIFSLIVLIFYLLAYLYSHFKEEWFKKFVYMLIFYFVALIIITVGYAFFILVVAAISDYVLNLRGFSSPIAGVIIGGMFGDMFVIWLLYIFFKKELYMGFTILKEVFNNSIFKYAFISSVIIYSLVGSMLVIGYVFVGIAKAYS